MNSMIDEPDLERLKRAYSLIATEPLTAFSELSSLTDEGSLFAHVYLGCMFANGNGVTQDNSKAEKHLWKAYDAGLEEGNYQLGIFYWREQQYRKAEAVFFEGSSKGYLSALYWLARVIEETPDYPAREKVMSSCFEAAAKRGHLYAQKRMVRILWERGSIVDSILMYLRLIARAPFIVFKDEFDPRIR